LLRTLVHYRKATLTSKSGNTQNGTCTTMMAERLRDPSPLGEKMRHWSSSQLKYKQNSNRIKANI